ncbi:MAG: protein kinase, partial [Myxococcales bacterium]|nr:protein kinase [Myxococcales bacterium]
AEAKNAARLEHPHNVKTFDFGHEKDGIAYIVMEVVRGRPLNSVPMPLPVSRVMNIVSQICGALSEAHQLGLVHRDMKPNNVMLTNVDGRDFVKVLDYGIAKSIEMTTGLTKSGAIVGTPEYLSPEQAAGRRVDPRSDIYCLGVMLFEMVTGRLPFESESMMGMAYAHLHTPAPSPSSYVAIPPRLEALINDCLAKQPGSRPQSMLELRDRLQSILKAPEADEWSSVEDTLSARTTEELMGEALLIAPGTTEMEEAVNELDTTERDRERKHIQTAPPEPEIASPPRRRAPLLIALLVLAGLGAASYPLILMLQSPTGEEQTQSIVPHAQPEESEDPSLAETENLPEPATSGDETLALAALARQRTAEREAVATAASVLVSVNRVAPDILNLVAAEASMRAEESAQPPEVRAEERQSSRRNREESRENRSDRVGSENVRPAVDDAGDAPDPLEYLLEHRSPALNDHE